MITPQNSGSGTSASPASRGYISVVEIQNGALAKEWSGRSRSGRSYYNENDPRAAAWLRALIAEGVIAPGDVDTRSIADVQPQEIYGYTQHHFFAGIGGWSLALRLAGWRDDEPAWTGSCPCQPFSDAGKQLGEHDPRHLWPQFRRLIEGAGPTIVFGEQVASALGRVWLAGIRADLEALGYAVGGADLCAAGVAAPHRRQRLYWLAHSEIHGRSVGPVLHADDEARDSRAANGSAVGGMADAADDGRAEHERESRRRDEEPGDAAERSGPRWLADANGNGCREGRRGEPEAGNDGPIGNGRTSTVADVLGARLEGHAGNGHNGHEPGRNGAHPAGPTAASRRPWDRYDLLPCRDGKKRRVEPGTFPLAHGVSDRVGILRGYGNAIVPQLAAEFIKASREALALVGGGGAERQGDKLTTAEATENDGTQRQAGSGA